MFHEMLSDSLLILVDPHDFLLKHQTPTQGGRGDNLAFAVDG